ncbi:uncharacterized protein LOC132281056 isoform X1 [Cornus florida]|uniref:uncharacterized protein LOC132281056 isoform X1 n=1 Tax=Cornus florida TaxID=4283 RepID=UPI00289C9B14|nr:uncharacterized protein LOC132281056 isoform X1 [Cornus florida]XP_059638843.1 uncharacterized protein LOC132281056 isoform X1 [Cornus florida]
MASSFDDVQQGIISLNDKLETLTQIFTLSSTPDAALQEQINQMTIDLAKLQKAKMSDLYPPDPPDPPSKDSALPSDDTFPPVNPSVGKPTRYKVKPLFYGHEDKVEILKVFSEPSSSTYRGDDYESIIDQLNCLQALYVDPQLTFDESAHIITRMRQISLQNENLLTHFGYTPNDSSSSSDEENTSEDEQIYAFSDKSDSSEELDETIEADPIPTSSSETTLDEVPKPTKGKTKQRPSETILDESFYGDFPTEDFLPAEEVSGSGQKTDDEKAKPAEPKVYTSSYKYDFSTVPTWTRKDDLNKFPISQHGTYLDLTNVPYKDHLKTIDEWAQSLAILVNNYKGTWERDRFLDYLSATLQGDALDWLRQWDQTP